MALWLSAQRTKNVVEACCLLQKLAVSLILDNLLFAIYPFFITIPDLQALADAH